MFQPATPPEFLQYHVPFCVRSNIFDEVEMFFGKPWMLGCNQSEVEARNFSAPRYYVLRGDTTHSPETGIEYLVTEYEAHFCLHLWFWDRWFVLTQSRAAV